MPRRPAKAADRTETVHGPSRLAPLEPDLRIGTELAGYRIDALAGRGGMGIVYRAEHVHLGRTVALKVLSPELTQSEEFRERFVHESRVAATIEHPNIITVYDAGDADGLLYIAMQFVEGPDLASILQEQGPLELERATSFLRQVAAALDAAHARGIVHRDVKPENILIDSEHCYLTDFGLGKRISSTRALTAKGQFVGTVDYIAPEQIEGGDVDARADVYALACVACHALTGTVPYERDSEVSVIYAHMQEPPPGLTSRRAELPPGLDAVVARAMAKPREERYGGCGEFVAALAAAGQAPDAAAAVPVDVRRPDVAGTAAKVLVADPEPGVRALIRAALESERLELLDAEDVESALELARSSHPELVLVGAGLGGGSAAELCAALRGDPTTAGTKLIGMTARSDSREKEALAQAGAEAHLAKPFSQLQLLYAVRELLGAEYLSG